MRFSEDTSKNYVFASILTGVYDVNRNQLLPLDDFQIVQDWYNSVVKHRLKAVIFHNNFSDDTIYRYQNELITFVKVDFNGILNANVHRYIIYRDYLKQHPDQVENLFVTDIADVVVLNNPFSHPLFLKHRAEKIFCGDEPKPLENEWMKEHSTHLRNNIIDYDKYEEKYQHDTLLNCGIIGGSIEYMQILLDELSHIHETYTVNNQTAYTCDMGAFNYVMRTKFSGNIIHGLPVNTIFKAYEQDNTACWFRHK